MRRRPYWGEGANIGGVSACHEANKRAGQGVGGKICCGIAVGTENARCII